jgi:hypothetical protein
MADLRDFTGKNRKFTGTIGERISTGTTAQRDDSTFGSGTLSFQYSLDDGVTWKTVNSADAALAFTAAEFTADVLGLTFELPKCQVRFSLSDSTDPDIDYFIKSLAQA